MIIAHAQLERPPGTTTEERASSPKKAERENGDHPIGNNTIAGPLFIASDATKKPG